MEHKELNLDNTQLNEQTEQIAKKPSPSPWKAKARQTAAALMASIQSLVPSAATTAAVGGGAAMLTSCEILREADILPEKKIKVPAGNILNLKSGETKTVQTPIGPMTLMATADGKLFPTKIVHDFSPSSDVARQITDVINKRYSLLIAKNGKPFANYQEIMDYSVANPGDIFSQFELGHYFGSGAKGKTIPDKIPFEQYNKINNNQILDYLRQFGENRTSLIQFTEDSKGEPSFKINLQKGEKLISTFKVSNYLPDIGGHTINIVSLEIDSDGVIAINIDPDSTSPIIAFKNN